ncbi:hypothetical protein BFP72_14500 [Reichenbachiella sp. 5M10]|uniref:hypothetical protein n=1 Tax=Reichenbachiella sp. 5M10 TaxID=1889772 RepID=UPI000C149638|nr:hypothetical protein [Reichenbachiella sp. 5M10]PIB36523.1 hypothetical protein BFP72_14500 [Reichenbachiella sp. 5M10]
MKIDLIEIWEFMEIAPAPQGPAQGKHWQYELVAGDIRIPNLSTADILILKEANLYDTELLPSIFTFREILWQPNVYPQPSLCIPQLNILKVFCEEYIADQEENEKAWFYTHLMQGLSRYCNRAIERINESKETDDVRIASILGELRKQAFPVIKFFISHPLNHSGHQTDALHRLNYAVKIMLTQYNSHYQDLLDPYWNITITDSGTVTPSDKTTETTPISQAAAQ